MILVDATHTSHTHAQTGIQRVVRSSFAELSKQAPATGICYDPYWQVWRPLGPGERDHLRPGQSSAGSRSAKWPLSKRLSGHVARLLGRQPGLPAATALIVPELFSAKVGANLPALFASVRGPRIAIFHDAIGLKLPELTPAGTVTRLPGYLRELLTFDGIAAVSEDSAASLQDYWRWLGVAHTPQVRALPLGLDPLLTNLAANHPLSANEGVPRILCVGTIEGRKNHLALLDACESLWQAGLKFELQMLGLARPDTAAAALAKISALQAAGRPLIYQGAAADPELHAAYAQCAFTVYPSMIEGFGLPVIESLQHGKPCVCSAIGALGESARGGGCLSLTTVDAPALAHAIKTLVTTPAELTALTEVARKRHFRTWADYAAELLSWVKTFPAHA